MAITPKDVWLEVADVPENDTTFLIGVEVVWLGKLEFEGGEKTRSCTSGSASLVREPPMQSAGAGLDVEELAHLGK